MMEPEEARLPRPFISFTPSPSSYGNGHLDFFSLFGRGKNKSLIAGADQQGFTFLYDLDARAIHKQMRLNKPKKYDPISVAVGDALYVMDKKPRPGGFEALRYDRPKDLSASLYWCWCCLPPPPFVMAPGYSPTCISAYAVVNGSAIWISTPGIGTYSFDTARVLWSKVGDWELPFNGRADYFPEYGLWLGFSSQEQGSVLCSSDLKTASAQCAPVLLHKDGEGLYSRQEDWTLSKSYLVDLGSKKFCVAKFFQIVQLEPSGDFCTQFDTFAVLTGLMLERGVNGDLRMIKHKSQLYRFRAMTSGWVF